MSMSGLLCGLVLCFPLELRAAEQSAGQVQPAAAPAPAAEPPHQQPEPAAEQELIGPVQELVGPLPPPQPLLSTLINPADAQRNIWSDQFADFANRMDRFFGDSRYFQEANKSVIQINLSKMQEPGVGGDWVLDGQARFDLPSTEKRFSLLLESNPEKTPVANTDTAKQAVLSQDVVASKKQAAALRYEKPPVESPWYFSADVGVKASIPLEPFVRTRNSYTKPWEKWRMKISEAVFWFSTIGVGETTQLDFERLISEPAMFRASTTATWMNDTHNFDLRQDFSVYHAVTDRTALIYQASVIGVSEPELQAIDYVLLLHARYRMHRSWVYFEISPQLHFPKAKDYQISPLLLLRLEVLFDESR